LQFVEFQLHGAEISPGANEAGNVPGDFRGLFQGPSRLFQLSLECEDDAQVLPAQRVVGINLKPSSVSSGSEIGLCLEAHELLTGDGVRARVVSMPCCELFDEQDQAYRDSVLPPAVTARVAVEAGIRQCWDRYLGLTGRFVGMSSFGASGPFDQLYDKFGITAANIVAEAKAALTK